MVEILIESSVPELFQRKSQLDDDFQDTLEEVNSLIGSKSCL